jgi:amidase
MMKSRIPRTCLTGVLAASILYTPAPATSPIRKTTAAVVEEVALSDLADQMATGDTSSEAITMGYLARIAAIDDAGPQLNAVIATMPDALEQARMLDKERLAGKVRGPLHGIPILLKDNIEAAGPIPTTAGSFALADNVTNRDAPLVARLRKAGAVILGKTNLSEWANIRSNKSTSGWSAVGGLTKNPYALDRNTCGSSSGSGAAVAASLSAAAIGTETDGSIVCPASVNGLVGFKPTLGLVSRSLIIPISHSQDTAGPMTRNVRDAAMVLTAIAGSDPTDPATAMADSYARDFAAGLSADGLKGKRIGVLRDRVGDDVAIAFAFRSALQAMEAAGAILVDINDSKKGLDALGEAEFQVLLSELKADLASYLSKRPNAKEGKLTLADMIAFNTANADKELQYFDQSIFDLAQKQGGLNDRKYKKALKLSKQLAGAKGIDKLLRDYKLDLLVQPTTGTAWLSTLGKGDDFKGPSASELPAVAGYPHITVPMTLIDELPIGVSFFGTKWQDQAVLNAGYAFEVITKMRRAPKYLVTIPPPLKAVKWQ